MPRPNYEEAMKKADRYADEADRYQGFGWRAEKALQLAFFWLAYAREVREKRQ